VEINCLKLHDTLKINPRIGNYQNHKNPSQPSHEDDKKSLKSKEVWLSQEERTSNKNWTLQFSLYFSKRRALIIHKYL